MFVLWPLVLIFLQQCAGSGIGKEILWPGSPTHHQWMLGELHSSQENQETASRCCTSETWDRAIIRTIATRGLRMEWGLLWLANYQVKNQQKIYIIFIDLFTLVLSVGKHKLERWPLRLSVHFKHDGNHRKWMTWYIIAITQSNLFNNFSPWNTQLLAVGYIPN